MKSATVTRADLSNALNEEVGLGRETSNHLVERVLQLIMDSLERGETVKLSGFGVFQVRAKNARQGRNPKTGEAAVIAPRRVISFHASQLVKARLQPAHAAPRASLT